MRHITKKLLALLPLLTLLAETFVGYFRRENQPPGGYFRREYQPPDDPHTHSEDLQAPLGIQATPAEVAPPPVPFVPDDDSQMYGRFFLAQQRMASHSSYMMALE
jgi:hypothetical protein